MSTFHHPLALADRKELHSLPWSREKKIQRTLFLVWMRNSDLEVARWWGEGNGTPLQYSCLENPMDGGAWWAAVHVVAKSRTWLSDFTFTFHFHKLEKEMATHSSVLAWRIPGTGEPGGLPSLGSHRVGHDWSDLASAGDEERLRRVTGAVFTRTWERKGEHASFCTMREHSGVEMERGAQF